MVRTLHGYTVQVATAHLNAPTTRQMLAEREASGRKLLQASNAQNLRMHAEYMLDGADPAFAKVLQVNCSEPALVHGSDAAVLQDLWNIVSSHATSTHEHMYGAGTGGSKGNESSLESAAVAFACGGQPQATPQLRNSQLQHRRVCKCGGDVLGRSPAASTRRVLWRVHVCPLVA
jgi:hypothetical protein